MYIFCEIIWYFILGLVNGTCKITFIIIFCLIYKGMQLIFVYLYYIQQSYWMLLLNLLFFSVDSFVLLFHIGNHINSKYEQFCFPFQFLYLLFLFFFLILKFTSASSYWPELNQKDTSSGDWMVCFFFFTLFIYLILAALSLRCWAFSSSA